MIGLVFALPQELESLRARLGPSSRLRADDLTFYYACVGRQPVVLVKSGIGRERSKRATESLLRIFDVDVVISAGLAGGLSDEVRTGELIIARGLVDYCHKENPGGVPAGSSCPCNRSLVDLSRKLAHERGLEFHCGDLVTVDEAVVQPALKRRIGEATSAVAVDMEGAGVAEAAAASGTPFLALKALSDEIDDELKGCDLVDGEGRVKILSVISYLINNPLDLTYLLRMRRKTGVALDKLTLFLRYFAERYRETSNPLHMVEK